MTNFRRYNSVGELGHCIPPPNCAKKQSVSGHQAGYTAVQSEEGSCRKREREDEAMEETGEEGKE